MEKIGEVITAIKNGQERRKKWVKVRRTRIGEKLIEVLEREGYIGGYRREEEKEVWIKIKYKEGEGVIGEVKKESKGTKKEYKKNKEIIEGYYRGEKEIITTTKGVYSNKEIYEKGIKEGGEVIIKIR